MKILFLTEFFPVQKDGSITGGSEGRTYYLSTELVKMGHNVSVITSHIPGSNLEENWAGLKIYRVDPERNYVRSGSLTARAQYFLNTFIKAWALDFDVVDGNNVACYFLAVLLAKTKGKKSTYWVPDIVGLRDWIKALGLITGTLAAIIEIVSVHIPVDHIISLSQNTTKKLLHIRVPARKISVIYPPILAKKQKSPGHPRTKNPMVLSVNRLVNYKRTDLVIQALAKLPPRQRFTYHVVGTGTYLPDLEKLVSQFKLNRWVQFLGGITKPELEKEMTNADIFSLPSEIEGFGIVTMEAMGFGTPFINSDIPVHQEIESVSRGVLLFKTGSVSNFLNQYRRLLMDRKLYKSLSDNAYQFASKHSQRFAAKEAQNVYQKITKQSAE